MFEWLTIKSLFTTLFIIVDIVAVFSIIWRSQGVERTLSWLFAVLAFPFIGAFLYFFLTIQPVKKSRKRKRKTNKVVLSVFDDSKGSGNIVNIPILNLASALTGLEASNNNYVEVLSDSEYAFNKMDTIIRSAKKQIWVEYYIIKKDDTGKYFLNLLADKAKEGIEVKLLYDAYGSSGLDPRLLIKIKAAGGRVEAFNPFNPFRRRWSFHLRNHRKLIVVDNLYGFTGGMNVGDEYSGRSRKRGGAFFHDTHLFIQGTAVEDLSHVFREDWAYTTTGEILPHVPISANNYGKSTVAIIPSGPDQFQNASALVFFEALNQAKETIYLTSPYFIPDEPMIRALEAAVLRGVDVRLIVPHKSDIILARQVARSHYAHLIPMGVKVFEYKPSMLHTKSLIVDKTICIVGSANLDVRSFRLNFELNALIFDKHIAQDLTDRFKSDIKNSKQIDPTEFAQRGFKTRLVERIARLLSPLL